MNKEIKIIDLLNKIAKGEEVPEKIRYNGNDYYFCNPCRIYEVIESSELCGKDLYNLLDDLNDKVEIIEEDNKIEKIDHLIGYDIRQFEDLREYAEITTNDLFGKTNKIIDKINELIDEINKLKEYEK